jgi:hypothetical protein
MPKSTCIQDKLTIMALMALEEYALMMQYLKVNSSRSVGLREPFSIQNCMDLAGWYAKMGRTTLGTLESSPVATENGSSGTVSAMSLW